MAIDLPESLNRYFAAQNDHDVDAMEAAFAAHAVVLDEGQTHVGRAAIREWIATTSAKYAVTVRVLSATSKADTVSVACRVAGTFPGSPVDLNFDFVLDDAGLIGRLEIYSAR